MRRMRNPPHKNTTLIKTPKKTPLYKEICTKRTAKTI